MISYDLDADDKIIAVGGDWDRFALDNDGGELADDAVIGRSLFDFLNGAEVKMLYRHMLQKVRESRKDVDFNIRCDAPECRRLLQLKVASLPNRCVRVESNLVEENIREQTMPALGRHVERIDDILTICCVCACVRSENDKWVEIEEEANRRGLMERSEFPSLSHGYCPECLKAQNEMLGMTPDN